MLWQGPGACQRPLPSPELCCWTLGKGFCGEQDRSPSVHPGARSRADFALGASLRAPCRCVGLPRGAPSHPSGQEIARGARERLLPTLFRDKSIGNRREEVTQARALPGAGGTLMGQAGLAALWALGALRPWRCLLKDLAGAGAVTSLGLGGRSSFAAASELAALTWAEVSWALSWSPLSRPHLLTLALGVTFLIRELQGRPVTPLGETGRSCGSQPPGAAQGRDSDSGWCFLISVHGRHPQGRARGLRTYLKTPGCSREPRESWGGGDVCAGWSVGQGGAPENRDTKVQGTGRLMARLVGHRCGWKDEQ